MAISAGIWFVGGVIVSAAAMTLKDSIANGKYPYHQLILKEVGKTMPKPIYTRVRKEGKWYVGQNKVLTPEVLWKNMVSDQLLLTYFKSESNVYPCLIKDCHKIVKKEGFPWIKIEEFKAEVEVKGEKKKGDAKTPKSKMVPTDVGLRCGDIIEPAKVDENKGAVTLVSEHYAVTFPLHTAELTPIIDESIKDVVVDLWKSNAERYSMQDWLSKYGPLVGSGVFLVGMVLLFMMFSKMIGAWKEAAGEPVKVAVEIFLKNMIETLPPPEFPTGMG